MNAIEVVDVYKKFKIYHDKPVTLKEKILFFDTNRICEDRWVLNGVRLSIEKGQVVGLIGVNGSGKSTLLKLMSRIIFPNKGGIQVNGRVSSLLELGAGFHPDMSGRENIYTNASIFGLSRSEINNKIDEIIQFSELEEFIDSPVRTYSSGMYMRLAFSVAINVDAEILLIDEILAVGDASFQRKCFNKLLELKQQNVTIVIVSHDLASLERICERVIWIENGCVREDGEPIKVNSAYLLTSNNSDIEKSLGRKSPKPDYHESKNENVDIEVDAPSVQEDNIVNGDKRWGDKRIEIMNVSILDEERRERLSFNSGESFSVNIEYRTNESVDDPIVGVQIFSIGNVNCYGTHTKIDGVKLTLKESGFVELTFEKANLVEGEYFIDVAITDGFGVHCDYQTRIKKIDILSIIKDIGVYRIAHSWKVD